MRGLRKWTACIFVSMILLAVHFDAVAQNATLTNITVSNTRDDLLLYLNLEGAFTEDIKTAILGGVPTSFSFFISLNRVQTYWIDETIADIEVTHTIKYDNLKKEFTVKRSWKEGAPVITLSFLQAQQWMTEVDALSVYPLKELEKGQQYQIRAMAEVSKLTLPLYLHYILFSLWDVQTDWYTIDFIY